MFSSGSAEQLHPRRHQEAAGGQLRPADRPGPHGRALPLLLCAAAQPAGPSAGADGPEAGEEEPGPAARGRLHPAQLLLTLQPPDPTRQNFALTFHER